MDWVTRRTLVTVKATPNPSTKYRETVCVAGIDVEASCWLRLYPIPFRDLEDKKKFKKYSIISVQTRHATNDHRPESYRVNLDSISTLEVLDTRDGWKRRKEIVQPTLQPSFCAIQQRQQSEDLSLGAFRPIAVDLRYVKVASRTKARVEPAQLSFLHPLSRRLKPMPYDFRYSFRCASETECPGHELPIIDWEIATAYWNWRNRYQDVRIRLEKMRERWLNRMCGSDKDLVFFVGNTKRFRDVFMVLGTFYPPK